MADPIPVGAGGPQQLRFEEGLRFLAAALALQLDGRDAKAIVTTACDALRCFLAVLDAAADRRLPDTEGGVARLRDQLEALLTPNQASLEAAHHAVEAALLARDQAAAQLPRLMA
ncbi:MAG TPA: hypothetical protein VL181_03225 [Holophagaceae bacterium]|nr:hypothetical protein [Holophagaceae bacterium]